MRIITGWKTKLGCFILFIAGELYIVSLWYPILERISIGIAIMGFAIAFYGFCNRHNRTFYMTNQYGETD